MKYDKIANVLSQYHGLPIGKRIELASKKLGISRGVLVARIVNNDLKFIDLTYNLRKPTKPTKPDKIKDLDTTKESKEGVKYEQLMIM